MKNEQLARLADVCAAAGRIDCFKGFVKRGVGPNEAATELGLAPDVVAALIGSPEERTTALAKLATTERDPDVITIDRR